MIRQFTLCLFICLVSQSIAFSQTASVGAMRKLPTLDQVLDMAVRQSPTIKESAAMTDHFRQASSLTAKSWMDKIFVDMGGQLSNSGTLMAINNNVSINEFNSATWLSANSVRAGLVIRLSLFDVVARKQQIQQANIRTVAAEQRTNYVRQEVKLLIIERYKEAELAYTLLALKSEKKYALKMQKELAEKEFQQGQLSLSELTRITEATINALTDFERTKADYEKLYLQLEVLTGTKFQ
jgi:outer membrane protein TolC